MVSANLISAKTWALPTGSLDGTLVIGLIFVFLAYVLTPRVVSAYQMLRAYRASRCIERHERVDVTDDPWYLFWARGRCDAATFTTLALLTFGGGSLVLELSLDLYPLANEAFLLTQPPPVFLWSADPGDLPGWHVLSLEEIDREYKGDWRDLDNVSEMEAKARYYVRDVKFWPWSEKVDRYINGKIVVASWSDTKPESMVYGQNDNVTVANLTCSSEGQPPLQNTTVTSENEDGDIKEWGRVLECAKGPALHNSNKTSKPSIILTENETGDVHVIVEETSTTPNFLYSVWNADGSSMDAATNSGVNITYSFHIASSMRLAEALVTAIVNDEVDGGGCFGLLRAFSKGPHTDIFSDKYGITKAAPFGEDPYGSSKGEDPEKGIVPSLTQVETINAGITLNTNAMAALVLLAFLSIIGVVSSVCSRSKTGLDVYNRDEVLRALILQETGIPDDPARHSAMRMYIEKKGGSGILNIAFCESDGDPSSCARCLLRRGPRVVDDPVPVTDNATDEFGGVPLPRAHRMYLRCRAGPRTFPRMENVSYSAASSVVLIASPVPSNFGSTVGSPIPSPAGGSVAGTPVALPRPPTGRGGSFWFDSEHRGGGSDGETDSGGYSSGGGGEVEMGMREPSPRPQVSACGGKQGGADSQQTRILRRGSSPSGAGSPSVARTKKQAYKPPAEVIAKVDGDNTGTAEAPAREPGAVPVALPRVGDEIYARPSANGAVHSGKETK